MIIDLTRLTANTQTWAQTPSTADVSVTLNGTARTLSGMAAAAYLFGQALTTIKFQDTQDGLQLTDGRFEFPPASGQWVSLPEVADALRYKYGVDPLIEFAPGLGVRGYSIPDINRILEALNREFAGEFSLALVSSTAVLAGYVAENNLAGTSLAGLPAYLSRMKAKATALKDFYAQMILDADKRIARYQIEQPVARAQALLNTGNSDLFYVYQSIGSANIVASNEKVGLEAAKEDITSTLSVINELINAGAGGAAQFDFSGFLARVDKYHASGLNDVMASINTLDVDTSLLVAQSQDSVIFRCIIDGNLIDYGGGLIVPEQILVEIPVNLDWNRSDWGIAELNPDLSPQDTIGFKKKIYEMEQQDFGGIINSDFSRVYPAYNFSALMQSFDPNGGYKDAGFPPGLTALLTTASTSILIKATETELRQNLTAGGDLYNDRFGAFYLNGVRTQAMDVAVTSRLLVQDNVSSEYKTLMDQLAERNNLIAAARTVSSGGLTGLAAALSSLKQQYGFADVLSELTAGQYSDNQAPPVVKSTDVSNDSITFYNDPGWATGTPVDVNVTSNDLSYGVVYYVRNLGSGSYRFYRQQDTADGTASPIDQLYGLVNLTSSVNQKVSTSLPVRRDNQVMTVGSVGDLVEPVPGLSYYQTFTSDGNFDTGTRVRLGAGDTTILNRNNNYYLRNDGGTYKLMSSLEAAMAGNDAYRAFLDANFSSDQLILMDVVNFNIAPNFASNYAMVTADPRWSTGTAVVPDATGGGLTAGTTYYVRSLGGGNYSFFSTAAEAAATGGTQGIISLTSDTVMGKLSRPTMDDADFTAITALLNTLISNKVRDGDLDQAKLQTLTAQLQNNTEAMTALIKAFSDMNAALAQSLR